MEESLTDRLTFLMNRVSDNQISEIIIKDRLQKKKCYGQRQIMLSYTRRGSFYEKQQTKGPSLTNTGSFKKKQADNQISDKPKKMGTVGSIWGLSKHWKETADKDGDNRKHLKQSEKSESSKHNFINAARTAVLMRQVAPNVADICTCESLDSKCMLHDA